MKNSRPCRCVLRLLPLLVDKSLMFHIAWVLTPYLPVLQIQHLAADLGHFIQLTDSGDWEDDLPF